MFTADAEVPAHLKTPEPSADELDMLADLTKAVSDAHENVARVAAELRDARDAAREARAKQANAFERWLVKVTALQNIRQYIRTEQERKQALADGRVALPAPPNFQSTVDAMAYHMQGGTRRAGGGGAYRRGAAPAQYRGRVVAPKVPSER